MNHAVIKFLAVSAIAVATTGFASGEASAQQVFRIVGADGKVTFSDKPPPAAAAAAATGNASTSNVTGPASGAGLPFELRQIAAKFPVTLYTGDNCGPCGSARSMLITRGVPFVEKTVTSNEDVQALQRISGENSLPFATVGGQQLKGYSDIEWTQFLNAAGYPGTSTLPPNYRRPAATPLVVVATAPASQGTGNPSAAPIARPATAASRAAAEPAVTPSNPGGIRF